MNEDTELTAAELVELERRLLDWPEELKEQGRLETVLDLLAARELALLPELTVEDVNRARKYMQSRPDLYPPPPAD